MHKFKVKAVIIIFKNLELSDFTIDLIPYRPFYLNVSLRLKKWILVFSDKINLVNIAKTNNSKNKC